MRGRWWCRVPWQLSDLELRQLLLPFLELYYYRQYETLDETNIRDLGNTSIKSVD